MTSFQKGIYEDMVYDFEKACFLQWRHVWEKCDFSPRGFDEFDRGTTPPRPGSPSGTFLQKYNLRSHVINIDWLKKVVNICLNKNTGEIEGYENLVEFFFQTSEWYFLPPILQLPPGIKNFGHVPNIYYTTKDDKKWTNV